MRCGKRIDQLRISSIPMKVTGFARPENQLHFYGQGEVFLAQHLGSQVEPAQEIEGHSGIISN
jgi:hypothetical protein